MSPFSLALLFLLSNQQKLTVQDGFDLLGFTRFLYLFTVPLGHFMGPWDTLRVQVWNI